jgi:dipeptidase E
MRLYLSSFRLGDHPDTLVRLAGGRRFAVVGNALDDLPPSDRAAGLRREVDDLGRLGLEPAPVDLRDPDAVAALPGYDGVWVRGGNVFTLRRALAAAGADAALADLLRRDALVYAGYSAGVCVLAPDLRGLEAVDPPGDDPMWTGLGLLDRPVVPHVASPGHPETAACDAVSAAFTAAGRPHWALRDGDVLVVRGSAPPVVRPAAATSGGSAAPV